MGHYMPKMAGSVDCLSDFSKVLIDQKVKLLVI